MASFAEKHLNATSWNNRTCDNAFSDGELFAPSTRNIFFPTGLCSVKSHHSLDQYDMLVYGTADPQDQYFCAWGKNVYEKHGNVTYKNYTSHCDKSLLQFGNDVCRCLEAIPNRPMMGKSFGFSQVLNLLIIEPVMATLFFLVFYYRPRRALVAQGKKKEPPMCPKCHQPQDAFFGPRKELMEKSNRPDDVKVNWACADAGHQGVREIDYHDPCFVCVDFKYCDHPICQDCFNRHIEAPPRDQALKTATQV
jgi:hypothetical protein